MIGILESTAFDDAILVSAEITAIADQWIPWDNKFALGIACRGV
jgi:hypothetical protein